MRIYVDIFWIWFMNGDGRRQGDPRRLVLLVGVGFTWWSLVLQKLLHLGDRRKWGLLLGAVLSRRMLRILVPLVLTTTMREEYSGVR